MRKLLLTFLCLFGFIAAWAAESTVTVDFPKDNPTWPNSSAYTGTTTSNDGNWTITNANNNNNGWGYVKIGGKKKDDFDGHTISALTSVKQLGIAVKTVAVNVQKLGATSAVINSIFVEVSADATFPEASTTKVTATLPSSYNNTDVTMTIAEPKANCYYRVTIDVDNPTTTNGAVWVNSYSFTGEAPANMTEAPTFEGFTGATAEYWDALNVKMNVPEGATVYYTTDDTTPTTSSTVYTAAGIDVPAATTAGETFVIKAIAVADGKEPSAIVTLTLTAVKTVTAELLSAIEAGGSYFLLADNTRLAGPIATGYYMPTTEVALADGKLVASDANLFTFEAGDEAGQFYIKDVNGKYYGMDATHNSFNTFADKVSATNALWTVTFADGLATITNVGRGNIIAYQSNHNTFSSVTTDVAASASLPAIYGEKADTPVVKQPAGLEFSAATAEATIGEAFTAPTLTFATTAAISYTSSTPAVATVDAATGVVTPLTEGTTTIMATSAANDDFEAGSAQYVLTVKAASTPVDPEQPEAPKPAGLAFSAATAKAVMGQTFTAPVLVKATDAAVSYNSSNSSVAVINGTDGALVLVAPGTTIITATTPANDKYLAGSAQYSLTVEAAQTPDQPVVREEPVMYFTPGVVEAEVGKAFTAPVLTKPEGVEVLYTSNNTDAVVVDALSGAVTLMGPGNAMVTATSPANASYLAGSAFYLITVKGGGDTPNPPQPGEGYSSLAEWMQAKPAADEAINAALTVLYQNGKDLFVKQADTYGFVYGDVAQEYTNGQVIAAGATGHYEEYNGMPEIIPVASTFAKGYDGAPEAPQLITGDKVTEANLLHYVRLESAKVEATETDRQFTVTVDGATFTLWNRWSKTVTNVAAADDADIYGFIGKTKIGDNIEVVLFPTRFEDNGGTPVNPGDNTATFDFTQPGSLSPAQSMPGAGADNAVDVNGVTFTSGVITLVNDKGTNNTSPRLYKSKEESEVELRVYNGGSTTISSTNGASITRIEFVTAYPANYDNSKADSGSLADAVWTGDATSVTFSWAKDSQGKYSPSMQKVIVTYGEGGEPGPVQPTEETATYNFQDPTTLSDPFEAPASGEGIELDGRTFTAGKTSITLSRGTNDKNAPRVFTSSKNVTDLRFYGDNTATIAGTGVTLKRIEFVCQYTSNFENSTASTGTLTDNIWTGEAASVDFHFLKSNPNSSGTTFNPSCTSIKVTYVTSSGIEEVVTIDTTPVEYYNLQGVRLEEPAPGQIVIRRQGNKVEKILVK